MNCRKNQSFFRKDHIYPKSHIRMDQKTTVDILKIELFPHSGCKYDRKLQTLALVDRHNLHRTTSGICKIYFAKIHLILLELFDITDKVKQSTVTRLLIIHCFFHKHMNVCPTLHTSRHSFYIICISRLGKNVKNQFMYRCIRGQIPQLFQLSLKSA